MIASDTGKPATLEPIRLAAESASDALRSSTTVSWLLLVFQLCAVSLGVITLTCSPQSEAVPTRSSAVRVVEKLGMEIVASMK